MEDAAGSAPSPETVGCRDVMLEMVGGERATPGLARRRYLVDDILVVWFGLVGWSDMVGLIL